MGAAEPASFDTISEIIRTNYYEWVSIGSATSTDVSSDHTPSSEKPRSRAFNDAFASRSYSDPHDGQGVVVRLAININMVFQSLRYLLCRVSVVAVSILHRSLIGSSVSV